MSAKVSKQAAAKAAQGYDAKPAARTCGNCKHMASDMVLPEWRANHNASRVAQNLPAHFGDESKVEKNLRCDIGAFPVKKSATCNKFEPKE